jgi:hypothetical protein
MPVKSNGRGAGNGVGSGTGNNGKGASDAFPDFDNPVAVFDYRSADGVLLYQRVRYRIVTSDGATVLSEKGRPDKTFRERRLDESGGWVPNLGGVAQYPRLPDLVQAIADSKTVFVPKSEGKADHLAAWGFAAAYVDKGVKPEDYIERFRGADIVLMPDNDDAGWEHINNIGATLQGVAGRIRVLVLPGLPHKGDVIDWAAAGGTPEQLRVLAGQAPDWEPLQRIPVIWQHSLHVCNNGRIPAA